MAESDTQAEEQTQGADTEEIKKTTRRPAKKRTPKKTAKKAVKKTRATKKQEGDDASGSEKKKRRPAKKRPTKKAAKKAVKSNSDTQTNPESKKTDTRKPTPQTSAVESQPSDAVAQSPAGVPPAASGREEPASDRAGIQWGRRAKRSGPIGWEEQTKRVDAVRSAALPASTPPEPAPPKKEARTPEIKDAPKESQPVAEAPAKPTPQQKPKAVSPPKPEAATAKTAQEQPPTEAKEERSDASSDPDQDSRRGRSRGRGRRGRSRGRSDDTRSRGDDSHSRTDASRSRDEKRSDEPKSSPSLTEFLAGQWTEEKTRRALSEGFLSRISPKLIAKPDGTTLPDADAFGNVLKAIRRVLSDECMVADDATDALLLDLVMSALADRIEVCRLQAESDSLDDLEVILDLRYKADRRLIEAVNALKNA